MLTVLPFGQEVAVPAIEGWCEDEKSWWPDEPVVRVTNQVTLQDGQEPTIFKNMLTGGWYRMLGDIGAGAGT